MKRWNTRPSYTTWDEVLHRRVNNCPDSIDPPCLDFEGAYAYLRDLQVHDKLRHGDIARVLHGCSILDLKEYNRMHKRLSRIWTKTIEGTMTRSILSNLKTKELTGQPVDVHGSIWWSARIPQDMIAGLPWHGKGNRGWHGIVTPSVTMKVFGNGKTIVHDHIGDPAWRIALVNELRSCGWKDQELGVLMEDLRLQGQEAHIVARNPGATPGIKEVSCNGSVIHTTDHTPYFNGSEELIVRLKSYFDDLYSQVHSLPKDLGLIMSGMPITVVLNNMMALFGKHSERIDSLEKLSELKQLNSPSLNTTNTASGTPPIGAPKPVSSGFTENAGELSSHSPPIFSGSNESQPTILSVTGAPGNGVRSKFCPKLTEHHGYLFCGGTILRDEEGKNTAAGDLLLATCEGAYENCRWFR